MKKNINQVREIFGKPLSELGNDYNIGYVKAICREAQLLGIILACVKLSSLTLEQRHSLIDLLISTYDVEGASEYHVRRVNEFKELKSTLK